MTGCNLTDFGKPARQNGKRLPCERLLDENARLRSCLSDDADNARQIMGENARLREFASEAWELLTCNEPNFVWSCLQKKARELGIEVEP